MKINIYKIKTVLKAYTKIVVNPEALKNVRVCAPMIYPLPQQK